MALRGALRRRLKPTFEETKAAKTKRLEELKEKRERAETLAELSKKEREEVKRIRAAKAGVKSRSEPLVRFAKDVLRSPTTKRIARKLSDESEKLLFGETIKPRRKRSRRSRRKRKRERVNPLFDFGPGGL